MPHLTHRMCLWLPHLHTFFSSLVLSASNRVLWARYAVLSAGNQVLSASNPVLSAGKQMQSARRPARP